jgi:hypothetical protein
LNTGAFEQPKEQQLMTPQAQQTKPWWVKRKDLPMDRAASSEWVTTTRLVCLAVHKSINKAKVLAAVAVSRFPVGSSANTTLG